MPSIKGVQKFLIEVFQAETSINVMDDLPNATGAKFWTENAGVVHYSSGWGARF